MNVAGDNHTRISSSVPRISHHEQHHGRAVRYKLGGVTCSRERLQLPDLRTRLVQ